MSLPEETAMTDPAGKSAISDGDASENALHYKRDFWDQENLKFSEPWYRLEKAARLMTRLAQGQERTLLDVGCGPATLQRLLPANIHYHGIDIAIHDPAPNLREADLVESAIAFDDKRFDFVVALGVFEYIGKVQSQKFAEVAQLLTGNGKFVLTYTNFGHRKKRIYEPFSNIQPLATFRQDLARYFTIDSSFPASHNWKHSQPNKKLVKAANMHLNANIPLISPALAVDYFFICSPRRPA